MIAEADRKGEEEQRETRSCRPLRPSQQQEQRQRHQHDVKGVHLRDDRLAPEGVRHGKQQHGRDRRGDRPDSSTATSTRQPARQRRFGRGRQIERVRGIASDHCSHRLAMAK